MLVVWENTTLDEKKSAFHVLPSLMCFIELKKDVCQAENKAEWSERYLKTQITQQHFLIALKNSGAVFEMNVT